MGDRASSLTLAAVTESITRQERKQRTRKALLDAALELLDDRGFASLSLREVAKQAGIVPTAFYRHFASMDELGVALAEESMRSLRHMIRSARQTSSKLIESSVHTLHEHVRAQRAHFRFIVRERYGGTGAVARAIAVELKLFASDLAVDLARLDGLREWPTDDLHMLADLIVAAMLATVLDLLDIRPDDAEADAAIVHIAQQRLRLIFLGASRWRPSVS
ncbi:MAG TPA: TetR family transcriptional regulator [Pseudonocardiaceae bacterium]|nr:TetR family transcriptional regulator [Pseudonocardiaceae bacterium]